MGKKERKEREQKRVNYATKLSAEKRKQTLIAVGVFAVIGVIVGYSVFLFSTLSDTALGGPENAGAIGSTHEHAALLVKIHGDTFEFSGPAFQIKSGYIHFEGRDGSTVHKHATGVPLGYLFETINIGLDDQCYTFPDGREYCTRDDYKLNFFINDEEVDDISDYEIRDDDRILIVYGDETEEQIDEYLLQLRNQKIIR